MGRKIPIAALAAAIVLGSALILPIVESIAVMSLDLGSEWIKVAIVKPGVPMEIALNKESRRKTPNAVAFKDNERHFSDPAMNVAVKKPHQCYLYLNHLLGKKFESPYVNLYQSRFPHANLVKDEDRGTVMFKVSDSEKFSPEELLAMILNNSRQIAENFADHPMKDAVITVPSYYNQAERRAVLESAKMVGLNVLQLMNDNTAVALNYGIFRAATFNTTETHVMFYDMGATSTTATIVGYSTVKTKDRGFVETVPQLAVKGVGFDPILGGLEMEFRLRDHLAKLFQKTKKTQDDITKNPRAMMKLLKEAARVKKILSANTDTFAQVENLFEGQDFKGKVTRDNFEEMCKDLFERVALPVETALRAAAMTLDHVDFVILMGGGTRVPKVQDLLKAAMKREDLGKSINTDESAALGAVYRAADLTTGFKVKRFLIKDVNMFPVDVSFYRKTTLENAQPGSRIVTRTLFHRLNPIPQKKVMTFNKQAADFRFNVSYGDTSIFSGELKRYLDLGSLKQVDLSGVANANENNKEATSKGIKAYFNMDDSGILSLDKIEAHFEKKVESLKEEEESTFAKIGSTLSSLFGSSKGEDAMEKQPATEEKKQEEKPAEESGKEEKEAGKDEKDKKESKTQNADEKAADKDEKKTEAKDDKKEEKSDAKQTIDDKDANKTSNKTAEKVEPAKPVIVRENISMTVMETDVPSMDENNFAAAVKMLENLHAKDVAKMENEQSKNTLESFLYNFKDKLYSDAVEEISTEEERNKISEKFAEVSDWLDEDGFDSTAEIYKGKLKELEKVTDDLRYRISEQENRPKAIAELLSSLNLTNVFRKQLTNMPGASEIYSEKDAKDLDKVFNEVKEWLSINWKKQNETDSKVKPVLLVKDIIAMQGKIDRELMYLINKAKYYVPKPKPKANTTAENSTSANKTESSDKAKEGGSDKSDEKSTSDKKAEESKAKKDSSDSNADSRKDGKDDASSKEGDDVPTLEEPAAEKKDAKVEEKDSKTEDKPNTDKSEDGSKSVKKEDEKVHKEL